jgi:uncharacterized membrane protein YcaP (DUF421 family)
MVSWRWSSMRWFRPWDPPDRLVTDNAAEAVTRIAGTKREANAAQRPVPVGSNRKGRFPMLALGIEWWQIIVRTAVVYLAMALLMRWLGRQSIGQRNLIDLVFILLVANAVQNAMVGPEASLTEGLVSAGTLFVVDYAISWLTMVNGTVRHLLEGAPVPLIRNRQRDGNAFRKYRITPDEEESALRGYGLDDPARIKTMVLELDGSISVVPERSRPDRTRQQHRYRRRYRSST